jgi:hypothetical protein
VWRVGLELVLGAIFFERVRFDLDVGGSFVCQALDPNTAVLAKLGFDRRTMPVKPMSVEQCVSKGLSALRENRSRIVPGRLNRFMDAFVPAFVKRTFTAKTNEAGAKAYVRSLSMSLHEEFKSHGISKVEALLTAAAS